LEKSLNHGIISLLFKEISMAEIKEIAKTIGANFKVG